MKKTFLKFFLPFFLLTSAANCSYGWGFWGHKKINHMACFTLPPEMIGFYKTHIDFLTDHAVDPDNRRYSNKAEPPRHYLDADHYGSQPFDSLPKYWKDAVAKYSEDTLNAYGIVPWYINKMMYSLTEAFKKRDADDILYYSANIGHYIADSHVPLHANSNHNGQYTDQKGIHGFWESRVPELLAEKEFDFFIGKAQYVNNIPTYVWDRVLESGAASDTVLTAEAELSRQFSPDKKYGFEDRNGKITRQYSSAFTIAYNQKLKNMVERRMRLSISSVASFWYTAWVNAGQPDLKNLTTAVFSEADIKEFEGLNADWKNVQIKGRVHE